MRIALIDYKKGNIKSVERSLADAAELANLQADVVLVDNPISLKEEQVDAIVLPGVGAFKDAMDTLTNTGLADALRKQVNNEVPFLGICLGLHLMYEGGTEHAESDSGKTAGLGLIPGIVDRMPDHDKCGTSFKVPHVGWNTVHQICRDPSCDSLQLFTDISDDAYFYFTHSYIAPASSATIGETTHSVAFPSVVSAGNAYGVQFHPEKSSTQGLKLLANFLTIAADKK